MVRLNDILEQVQAYLPGADFSPIEKAYIFSARVHEGQVRLSGEPYLSHPLEVAYILTQMRLDVVTVACGLLHDTVEDTLTTLEEIKELFGEDIARVVDGVTKISRMPLSSRIEEQAGNVRKMILAMSDDIRVLLVKLADRIHNMRTLHYQTEAKRIKIARETMDIYAPLAGRMGIEWIKRELEDLSFSYIQPETYQDIKDKLEKSLGESKKYIEEVKSIIKDKMAGYGIECEVRGRPKHIYSIYKKMVRQNLPLEQIYDVIAFRLILKTVKECYEALGIIHSIWMPVPGRFKDYVSLPKANMYQSLHTTVIGPYGRRMEVQIRTEEMDKVARAGIAAHWMYKEDKGFSEEESRRFAWLKQLLEWQKDLKDPREFLESVRVDLYPNDVYVFTPEGEVKEFPRGATPVDFAYAIHTEVGRQCTGAKVNGRLVPIKYELKNGDVVEIITAPHHTPSKDWLKFVKTTRARTRIKQWFKTEEQESSVSLGKEICEKEFRKHRLNLSKLLKSEELTKAASELSFGSVEDLLAGVGYGKISPLQIVRKLLPPGEVSEEELPVAAKISKKKEKIRPEGIKIRGVEDIMIRFGRCCNPLPGDDVVGFITRGRGVTVHTSNCRNIVDSDSERRVDVQWDVREKTAHPVKVRVVTIDKKGLLAAISNAISACDANIVEADIHTTLDHKAILNFILEVVDTSHLKTVLKAVKHLEDVIRVERLTT